MRLIAVVCCALGQWIATSPVRADPRQDCSQGRDRDLQIRACSQIVRWDRKAEWAYYNRGIAYNAKGDHDRAIADFNESIRLIPGDARTYVSRGNAYRAKRDHDRAIADYITAITLNPSYAHAYFNRGNAYHAKGENDRAIADYTEAIKLNPNYEEAHYNRGIAHRAKGENDRAIADFNESIRLLPRDARTYFSRGIAYRAKGDHDRAIADYTEAIRLNPSFEEAHYNRGNAYRAKGDYDRAIADFNESIRLVPGDARSYVNRGNAYQAKGDRDRAIADYVKAITLNPSYAPAYVNRGNAYHAKGDHDRAIADYTEAIKLNPSHALAYNNRGNVHFAKRDYDRALADYSEAIRLGPTLIVAHSNRGETYEAKGDRGRAIEDYSRALALPAATAQERTRHAFAERRLAALRRAPSPATTPLSAPPPVAAIPAAPKTAAPLLDRRVALVVGNSAYTAIERLPNPANDARAVAASLRRLGFAEVIEHYDVSLSAMVAALKAFGDKTIGADWAIIYYAGHGIEVGGTTYLLPTDARLLRAAHILDEALPLERVLAKVENARRLRLVVLDACRNNPFLMRMARERNPGRSIGRGLARIEPDGGVIVAYAAKHGTIAQDGAGTHSPFTEAFLHHLEEPGLEISLLFRKVRDRVLERTGRAQEPFVYGSLGSEPLYFQVARAR